MKNTQPLSACCNAPHNQGTYDYTGEYKCSVCNQDMNIATPAQTIKAQTVSGTSVNVSSSKNIPTQNIATPEQPAKKEKEGFTTCCNYVVDTNGREFRCRRCHKPCDMYGVVIEATPDTEDDLEKEIEFIVNPQPELSEMLEGNFTKLFKQLQKDLIRKLIRTEKLKVLEQVKLEKPESAGVNDFQNGVYSGYLNAIDDLNAIREKLQKDL